MLRETINLKPLAHFLQDDWSPRQYADRLAAIMASWAQYMVADKDRCGGDAGAADDIYMLQTLREALLQSTEPPSPPESE